MFIPVQGSVRPIGRVMSLVVPAAELAVITHHGSLADADLSIIAVLGTLAGTTVGYVFQRRITDRNEAIARDERLRQERLVACSVFAGAVMDLRRAQYDRWYRHEHPQQRDPDDARTESYRLRSIAWSAFHRFRLTTADNELTKLGWSAVEEAAHVANATDEADLRERGERAGALLEDFVTLAARQFDGNVVGQHEPGAIGSRAAEGRP